MTWYNQHLYVFRNNNFNYKFSQHLVESQQPIAAVTKQSIAATFGLYHNLLAASVLSIALRLTAFLESTYLFEEVLPDEDN